MSEQTNQPKVYLVSTGSYSDYGIQSAWTTQAAAETYAALLDHDAQVEEYELRTDLPGKFTVHTFEAVIEQGHERPANAQQDLYHPAEYWEDARFEPDHFWKGVPKVRVNEMPGERQYAWLEVEGVDRERAEKAFHDRLAEVKARQAGVA